MRSIDNQDVDRGLTSKEVDSVNAILDSLRKIQHDICGVAESLLLLPGFGKQSVFLTRSYESFRAVCEMVELRLQEAEMMSLRRPVNLEKISDETAAILKETQVNSQLAARMSEEAERMSGEAEQMNQQAVEMSERTKSKYPSPTSFPVGED